MPRVLPLFLIALVPAFPVPVFGTPDLAAPGLPRGPMVQLTTPNSGVLVWRTESPITPVVRFGTSLENLNRMVEAGHITVRAAPDLDAPPELPQLHSAPPGTRQYEAHLTGLLPDTAYHYAIFDEETLLAGCTPDHVLRTQPTPSSNRPLRFWMTGDTGKGNLPQQAAFRAMQERLAAEGRPLDAYLHLGDMAYDSGLDEEFQTNFFDIYAPLLRNTVTWATMGNHEGYTSDGLLGVGPYYDAFVLPAAGEAGGVPSGTEAYYSFDYGPIHFICLNSYDVDRSAAAAMGTWLQADLAQNNSKWLIAFWHHPPYSKGTHNSDTEDQLIEMREQMLPLLEAHGVDLVLCGHSHVYERSMLITGAYATPTTSEGVVLDDGDGRPDGDGPYLKAAQPHSHNGTVAVVSGHGSNARRFSQSPVMRVSVTEVGSVLLDVEGDTITLRMLNAGGVIRDHCQLVKRETLPPRVPLSDPWNPFGPILLAAHRVPGELEVHLFPRPQAPDAELHYTLDGSEPTTGSPTVGGPLVLTENTVVKAFSRWRNGTRTSPVAMGNAIVQPDGPVQTLQVPILFPDDDASESAAGEVALDRRGVGLGPDAAMCGLRFPNIPLSPDITIYGAAIQFTARQAGREPASWTIQGDLSGGDRAYLAQPFHLSSRRRTARAVTWEPASWFQFGQRNDFTRTPDLASLVEELLAQPDWTPGDSMSFLLTGTGERLAYSSDEQPGATAQLIITYDKRDPLDIASDLVPIVELEPQLDGPAKLFITFSAFLQAQKFGIAYGIEGSPDLTPGSWTPLTATFSSVLPDPTPYRLQFRYQVNLPDGVAPGDHYFLRVRTVQQ